MLHFSLWNEFDSIVGVFIVLSTIFWVLRWRFGSGRCYFAKWDELFAICGSYCPLMTAFFCLEGESAEEKVVSPFWVHPLREEIFCWG